MANPLAGEVEVTLDGTPHVAKLTLGALAELETALGETSLFALVERFETGRFSARDVLAVVLVGLRGGGWQGDAAGLGRCQIGQGPLDAARLAAALLVRAFADPGVK